MIIFKSINKLNKKVNFKANVGFVPTMGALHKGHISLINESKKRCKKTLVSIFINPSQFNKLSDLKNYPKKLVKDIKILRSLKIDYLLLPRTSEIYKKRKYRQLKINKKDKIMCALYRPGHFEGVLAVINQYLISIKVNHIFLGEKDYQQFFLIKNFVKKKFKIKVHKCKTVRDKSKIALSSRNYLLTKKSLLKSSIISKILLNFNRKLKRNFLIRKDIKNIYNKIDNMQNIKIEYLEIRNRFNLSKKFNKTNFKIFIAYYNNKVRLIDNY